jgi:hypothetical protein
VKVQLLKYDLKRFVPIQLWMLVAKLFKTRREHQYREVNAEAASEATYLIIRRRPPGAGLFSNVNHVLQGLLRAESLGLIPVVDMQNYVTEQNCHYKLGDTRNAWEYFFRPVSDVRLEDMRTELSCVLTAGDRILPSHWLADLSLGFMDQEDKIAEIGGILESRIKLNDFCNELLIETVKFIEWDSENTLGLFYRGTDYIKLQPKGHAVQPTPLEFINKSKKLIENSKSSRLLLVTQDKDVKKYFTQNYKNIMAPDLERCDYFRSLVRNLVPNFKKNDERSFNTYRYLIETYLLSKAESCIASVANGSAFAILLNQNQYKEKILIRDGIY